MLTVLAGIARYASGVPHVLAFVVAGLALAGGAWVVSFATEQVGGRFGTATTGMMQSTLGNLPEFFVVLFALQDHQLIVAQTAVLGSILVNALLVLGLVVIAGARRSPDGIMRFSKRLPNDTTTLLLLASFIILLVGIAANSHTSAGHVKTISIVSAIAILTVYAFWVRQYLTTEQEQDAEGERPRLSTVTSVVLLVVSGAAAGFVSDWFVHALVPTIHSLGISKEFAGLVIVAIAGNAVENVVGVQLAARNKPDFAVSVIVNSSLQVALALTPVLIFVSLLFTTHLTLVFPTLLALVLVIASILGALIVNDGESTWQEGVVLIGFYVVIAASFWWGT
ncbi:MAG TPA: hypothetical protein VFW09_22215 [Solirubrobacteraceae bacterium]|nr:hypothetical protein [Solirubrobacteraceae bacterium]